MKQINKHSSLACWSVFLICTFTRIIEYFYIRTDETILAENVFHKLFGIGLLFIVLRMWKMHWSDIGFTKKGIFSNILKGLLLGTLCFTVAYSIECLILFLINNQVNLSFYASGFSLSGESVKQTGFVFIFMCIVFNLINVWMEEGIFRGLFTKITKDQSILFVAFLFGIWHLVMPLRDYLEARTTFLNLVVMGVGYIILAGIMSVKWSLLYRLTGSLWMGLGDHLFNNVVVTNLVHVISNGEGDSMQIVRILIGQLLSFGIVYLVYKKRESKVL